MPASRVVSGKALRMEQIHFQIKWKSDEFFPKHPSSLGWSGDDDDETLFLFLFLSRGRVVSSEKREEVVLCFFEF